MNNECTNCTLIKFLPILKIEPGVGAGEVAQSSSSSVLKEGRGRQREALEPMITVH